MHVRTCARVRACPHCRVDFLAGKPVHLGCSLDTRGCSLHSMRLQPAARTKRLNAVQSGHTRLQPGLHTVADFPGDYDDFTKRHASFVADCRRKAKAGGKELHKLQAQIAKGEGAGASKSGRKQAPGCT